MCESQVCSEEYEKELGEKIRKLKKLTKALHCNIRWDIIDIIGIEEVKTKEIRLKLLERGHDLSKPGFYYHLSELKNADVIEVSGYLEEGQGAPEKKWRLARKKIEIDLVNV